MTTKRVKILRDVQLPPRTVSHRSAPFSFDLPRQMSAEARADFAKSRRNWGKIPGPAFKAGEVRTIPVEVLAKLREGADWREVTSDELSPPRIVEKEARAEPKPLDGTTTLHDPKLWKDYDGPLPGLPVSNTATPDAPDKSV